MRYGLVDDGEVRDEGVGKVVVDIEALQALSSRRNPLAKNI
jgi:hypothetical protein